ncbi:cytochrome c [Marinobacteraceae bacterium S3BR75-40.1]
MTRRAVVLLVLLAGLAGCQQKMTDQPRYEAYEEARDWANNQSARRPVPGTVARGESLEPVLRELPMPLTRELLETGRERFEIYCTPCHGYTGHGNGMVPHRGFPNPPSFHSERLRNMPLRHFYDVITDGFGVMYSYKARVQPEERWAIAAYIRALQLSQNTAVKDLTWEQRAKLEQGGAP